MLRIYCSAILASMIKAITLIKRKTTLTVEEFQHYWLQQHVAVIRQLPGIRRYVQNHPLPENYRQGELPYDGVAELWGDSSHTFRALAADPAYTAVQADEAVFIDRNNLDLILTSETTPCPGSIPAAGVKLIELFRRRPGTTVTEFQRYWREVHTGLIARLPRVCCYTQSLPRPGGYASGHPPTYDGQGSLWFASPEDLRQVMNSGIYTDIIRDQENFIDTRSKLSMAVREHIIIS